MNYYLICPTSRTTNKYTMFKPKVVKSLVRRVNLVRINADFYKNISSVDVPAGGVAGVVLTNRVTQSVS